MTHSNINLIMKAQESGYSVCDRARKAGRSCMEAIKARWCDVHVLN